MKQSVDRILTTHVGSLPRPQAMVDLLFAEDRGEPADESAVRAVLVPAVAEILRRQVEAGIDVVSDGEMGKISYATYIRHRLTGFEGDSPRPTPRDIDEIPEYRDQLVAAGASARYRRPVCTGPIAVKDLGPLHRDIAAFKAALAGAGPVEGFMNAVSPGTVAVFQPNEYYASHALYVGALADALRDEFEAITDAGLLLQVDCPDLAMGRHSRYRDQTDAEFLETAALHVEALNHALAGVPPDRVRLHICWGNYEGPHNYDIPLEAVLPLLFRARARGLLIEGANPRHEHEWAVWEQHRLPDDKLLIPGVIDSCCNFVEHPELVAQRLTRYAGLVGRERVIAGTDCGFGTFAGFGPVHPRICWMKLQALAEGARIASERLWRSPTATA